MIALLCALAAIVVGRPEPADDVLAIARKFPDGGGYAPLSSSGVARDIEFKGCRIIAASQSHSFYCCGFTFATVMQTAQARGLLVKKEAWEVSEFQKNWYGATKESKARQAAFAMEKLGIGREVSLSNAQPGDFATFSRRGSGHSVVILQVLRQNGRPIGLHYRSSQESTNGVGDAVEYFKSSGYANATIIDRTLVVARLSGT